jgi:hypothetical protein
VCVCRYMFLNAHIRTQDIINMHLDTGYPQNAFYIHIYIYICIERDIDCQIVLYGTRLKHFLLFTFETPPFIFSQQVGHSTVSFLFGTIS